MKRFKVYEITSYIILHGDCPYCLDSTKIKIDGEYEEDEFVSTCNKCGKDYEVLIPEWEDELDERDDNDDEEE